MWLGRGPMCSPVAAGSARIPAAGNAAAIRAYEKAGFKPVGVMHAYERDYDGDGWHDCLLMEWVSEGGVRARARRAAGSRLRP